MKKLTPAFTCFSLLTVGSLLVAAGVSAQPCLEVECPTNKVLECGTPWDFDAPTVLTNCCAGDATITILTTTTNGLCPQIFTRIWEITNLCADTLTCTQTVTAVDTTPPVLTCAAGKTVECGTAWSFDSPSASDVCSGVNAAITILSTETNGTCPQIITRTWVATDPCGNSNTCSQTVTVVDTTPPTINCSTNKTVACGLDWRFNPPTASDNCSGLNVTVTFTTVTNSLCPTVVTRTWTATDLCGHTNSCSQTVTVAMSTNPPVFINCPASTNLGCNPVNIPDCATNVRAVANCGSATNPPYLLVGTYNHPGDVRRYDGTTGAFIDNFVPFNSGGLDQPNGLVFGPDGNLYVSTFNHDDVKRYDGTTGAFIDEFVPSNTGGLNRPYGLVFGPDGNLYVSSYNTSDVKRYNGMTGEFIDNFVPYNSGGLYQPKDLVFGPDGHLYVSSSGSSEVKRYHGTTGAFMDNFVPANSGGLNGPYGVVFGPDGNLYVSSLYNHTVNRYHGTTGAYIDAFVAGASGGLIYPQGLVFGPDGNLYVSSSSSGEVKRYNGTTGAFMGTFTSGGGLIYPTDVIFTPQAQPAPVTCARVDTTNGCTHTRTITYTAVDACNNSNTCAQVITWTEDTTPPVFTCASNKTAECGSSWSFDLPVASDNCSGTNVAITVLGTVTNGVCPKLITRTWLATDLCGNTNACSQTVTIVDTTPPVLTCASNKTVQCNPCNLAPGESGFSVLKSFTGSDGAYPLAGLVAGSDGALYGTTVNGGSSGSGTVFKLSTNSSGSFTIHTVLKNFTLSDGVGPNAGLVAGSDGALYGTTVVGGSSGAGTVFKLSKDGTGNYTIHTVLKSFNYSDGRNPIAGLVEGSDGALYSTTYEGGSSGFGTVFKMSTNSSGNYTIHTVLKSFTGSDGAYLTAGLVAGSDGALYGTTEGGGSSGYGTVFKMSKDGSGNYTVHTVLKSFTGSDGAYPRAGLVEGNDGALYGTTYQGGSSSLGTVFKVGCAYGWHFDPPTATDNCSGTNVSITVRSTVTNGVCPQVITRTWLATDACGNTNMCSQSVTLADTVPPMLTCASNKSVECGSSWNFDLPTANDNCSGTNVAITVLGTVTNGVCPQLITRTWKAADLCGNTNTCSQTVTVVDTIPPVITCSSNKTVSCGSSWNFDAPSASDAYSGTNVAITILSTVTNGICPQLITRTWLATDLCGNTNSCSQTVTVMPDYQMPAGLVSWWPGDGNAHDIVGGNNGSLQGTATYSAGEVGQAFTFSDASAEVIVPHSASLNVTGPLTIEIWLRVNSFQAGGETFFWKGDNGGNASSPYALGIDASHRLYGSLGDVNSVNLVTGAAILQSGVWYHVAFTTDGSQLKLYLNGVLDGSATQTLTPAGSTYPLQIGRFNSQGTSDGLIGQMDEVSLYNRALSLTELASIYAAGSAGKNKPALLTGSTNKTVECGVAWSFDVPTVASSCSGLDTNPVVLGTITNGLCPQNITRTWLFTNSCGFSNLFSQTVTLVDTTPPVLTCASNKTVQLNVCSFEPGQGFSVLKNFTGSDGANPYAGLVAGSDGALYGTTFYGGSSGAGTVFRLSKDGIGNYTVHTVLKSFTGSNGANPYAGLVAGSDGALYGTTVNGGSNNYGTVFKLSKDGTGNYTIHTVLKSFTDSDGANPYASLMEASDGAVYGTTFRGSNTRGTVFKLSKDGNGNYTIHTVLKNFTGTDGFYPYAALVEGSDGVLYGTTYQGGSNNYGTVFKLSKDGTGNYTIHTALKSFTGSDGAYPYAGLLAGSDGALYGTTASGGSSVYGTVFKMSKDGSGNYTVHTVLKNFTGADGANPPAGLVEGSDGALYGTTANGGSSGYGTVFRLSTNGSGNYIVHTVLKSFTGSDGANPYAGLVEANDGALYGTTYYGGSSGNGTVFRIGCVSSGWSFDAPTAVDNCSGTNVAITIVSTITNGPCQQFITRTWLATDLCGNTSTCSQTVTLTNSVCTPPAFTQFAYNGNIFSLSFQTLCGFNYQVQYKNALTDPAWTPLPAVSGTGGIVTVQDTPTPQQMRFYRVACLEP